MRLALAGAGGCRGNASAMRCCACSEASEALESDRLKTRVGEMLLERELLEAKIAALEARDPRPLPRPRSRR
jgi:hypothetical protein